MEKKYKKLKIITIILGVIVILGMTVAGIGAYYFFNRDALKQTTLVQEMQFLRNKVKHEFYSDYEYTENVHNAAYKLDLNDGKTDMHATHPKILNFKEKWNGYKYWLVYSPYPFANDKYENPWLVASNDLKKWETPKGLKN